MKTAISVPDDIFDAAEELSKRLRVSRSEFYSTAISDFIKKHRHDGVTEALDRVYAEEESVVDPILNIMQQNSLPKDEWCCVEENSGGPNYLTPQRQDPVIEGRSSSSNLMISIEVR